MKWKSPQMVSIHCHQVHCLSSLSASVFTTAEIEVENWDRDVGCLSLKTCHWGIRGFCGFLFLVCIIQINYQPWSHLLENCNSHSFLNPMQLWMGSYCLYMKPFCISVKEPFANLALSFQFVGPILKKNFISELISLNVLESTVTFKADFESLVGL